MRPEANEIMNESATIEKMYAIAAAQRPRSMSIRLAPSFGRGGAAGIPLGNRIVVDDVETVINPKTLKGQIHGGVVQGLGQALMEQVLYERSSGQLTTASFMDYAMPRAQDVCDIEVHSSHTRHR
jgi:hypothetical protein